MLKYIWSFFWSNKNIDDTDDDYDIVENPSDSEPQPIEPQTPEPQQESQQESESESSQKNIQPLQKIDISPIKQSASFQSKYPIKYQNKKKRRDKRNKD